MHATANPKATGIRIDRVAGDCYSRSRLNVKPRNQKPLAIAEKLHPAQHAFDLTNAFRDGAINMAFGTPGLPGGEVPTIHLQVTCELSTILTGMFRNNVTLQGRVFPYYRRSLLAFNFFSKQLLSENVRGLVRALNNPGLNETVFFTRAALCPICDGRGAPEVDMRPCKYCRYAWCSQRRMRRVRRDHGGYTLGPTLPASLLQQSDVLEVFSERPCIESRYNFS